MTKKDFLLNEKALIIYNLLDATNPVLIQHGEIVVLSKTHTDATRIGSVLADLGPEEFPDWNYEIHIKSFRQPLYKWIITIKTSTTNHPF